MRNMMLWLLLGVVPGANAGDPLVFTATAMIDVDEAGRVTAVEPDAALSPALQQVVREQALSWRFSPPVQDGVPVAGTTYVDLKGCAIPDGDAYRVALDFKGNGPRYLQGSRINPPRYPVNAYRNGREASAVVTYRVETDGSARLEGIRYTEQKGPSRDFDKEIARWVGGFKYAPERLAGQAVRTRIEIPVSFELGDASIITRLRQETERKYRESPECVAATAGDEDRRRPVAMDSPFSKLPEG
jgi:TonB family protein